MKNLLKQALFLCFVIMLSACTSDSVHNDILSETVEVENFQLTEFCSNQDPTTRVVNNGTVTFDLLVTNADGTFLAELPNILSNTTTSWVSFPEGDIVFSLTSNDPSVSDTDVVLKMGTCMVYEIEVDSNNQIVSFTSTSI